MPSIPAASNGGEDRVAHTGAAVTSPAASAIATSMAGSRCWQPAASRASRQACRACAAGTSRMNGLLAMACLTVQRHVDLGTGVEPGRLFGDDDVPVGGGEPGQHRRRPEYGRGPPAVHRYLHDVEPPGGGRQAPG